MTAALISFHRALFACTVMTAFMLGAVNEARKDQLNTLLRNQIVSMSLAQLTDMPVM